MEGLEVRNLLAGDTMTAGEVDDAVLDINQDGAVGPTDVLMILDCLNEQQESGSERDPRMDVNADGAVSPLDAMMVIQRMGRSHDGGRQDGGRPADGEGGQVGDASSSQHDADVVLAWNNLFNELLVANETDQNPGFASRAMAMLNVAIYDAVTMATGGDDTFYDYGDDVSSSGRIRARVAASEAAYTVLGELYPDQQSTIDDFRDSMRTGGRRNAASREMGRAIGNGVIEARANDGSDAIVPYTYTPGIGSFQADPLNPDVPVWGPGWGEVETFAISSAESFAPETTPPIDGAEYAASYNEVKALGAVDSATRTADQTEAGIFWAYDRVGLGTPMALFNDVLESVGVQQGNSLAENAAMYAQASVAMADAGIVAWHTKFSEEFWRPITAIRDGDLDGNALTDGDLDWTALGAPDGGNDIVGFTPQFPTYISGHATFGGALFGALQEFYGTDDIAFEVSSNELEILMENPALEAAYGLDLEDAVRTFDSFSEAMAENGRSRVYLGIHFDFDDLVGQEVGQAVATTVASEFVVPTRGGGHGGPGGPGAGPGGGPGGHGDHGGGRRGGGPRGDRLTTPDGTASPELSTRVDVAVDAASTSSLAALDGQVQQMTSTYDQDDDELTIIDSIFAEEVL